jgi:hypothetical protein
VPTILVVDDAADVVISDMLTTRGYMVLTGPTPATRSSAWTQAATCRPAPDRYRDARASRL